MGANSQGLIIAVLSVALIAALGTVAVMAMSGGDESPSNASGSAIATSVPATSTTTAVATVQPATAVPPTQPPPPTEAPPPPPPTIRTCAEIRADPAYRSEEERQFFLSSCQPTPRPAPAGGAAPAVQAPAPGPAGPSAPSAEEASYISRCSAAAGAFYARFAQYFGQPSLGARSDIQELATVTLNFANSISTIQPVPGRFQFVHANVIGRALAFYDALRAFEQVNSLAAFTTWLARYERTFDEFDAAFSLWIIATGIQVPSLGGLR